MKEKVHILIVEDHLGFAQGIRLLLEQHPKVGATDIVTNFEDTLSILKQKSIDIVILDLHFETNAYDGFTIANKLKQLYPVIKIMILTQHARKHHYKRLFEECKVDAYLDKKLGIEETYTAIDAVMDGKTYIDASIEKMLEIEEWMTISEREKQVIALLSKGYLQKQIADDLCIAQKTVETHVRNLFEKFKVKNSVQLVVKYMKYKNANRDNVEDTTPPFKE